MANGNVYLVNMLEMYRKQLNEQKVELKEMPRGYLSVRVQDGYTCFAHVIPKTEGESRKYIRKGITKNQHLVNQLARKKYLQLSIKTLSEEIDRLERFIKIRTEPEPENILEMLPERYRQLPEEMFFPEMRSVNRWAAADYEQNMYYVEEKIHTTSRGLKVRSKSELLIAEKLDQYDIPYRYDAMIYFQKYSLSPDFMVPTRDGMMYWEHCGMMEDPGYRFRNKKKLTRYEAAGIVPWKNLIVTYDSEDGGLDLRIIESEIVNKLLPMRI